MSIKSRFAGVDIWIEIIVVAGLYAGATFLDRLIPWNQLGGSFLSLQTGVVFTGIFLLGHRICNQLKKDTTTEAVLKQKNGELVAFLNNLPDIGWLTDNESRYLLVNKKFSDECGLSPEGIQGKTAFDVWPHETAGRFAESDEKVIQTGESVRLEHPIVDSNGIKGWVEILKNPIYSDQGTIIGTVSIVRNITERKNAEHERKQLESQLRQSQKMEAIGTLAGGIAHDFNNILAVIMGYTEISLAEIPVESQVYRRLERILKAGHRGKELVNQILIFSRQHERERKPVGLSLIVEEVLKLLRPLIPTTIEISRYQEGASNVILADPTQIYQILINLCTNSAYAMRDKCGRLEVRVEDLDLNADEADLFIGLNPGPYVRLTVSDTGHGLDHKTMERIFEPFFTTKNQGEGTGMGLAVVHGIVKSLNGIILVDGKPGKGTTFQIFIPRIETDLAEVPPKAPLISIGNERILFVDDDELIVEMIPEMLKSMGYQVICLRNSSEALEVFHRQHDRIDLVITDQTMPNMTGEELAKEIMRIRADIPIILCTGFSEAISPEKARALGIREYVMKPFTKSELSKTIRKVLDNHNNQKPIASFSERPSLLKVLPL